MKIGAKLQQLRKTKGLTQEELADYLNVSRQSISKWELDGAYPETEKLIKLAQLYDVTIDSFLYPENEMKETKLIKLPYHYEYKSKRSLFGYALVHINIGLGKQKSKGIISIGNVATGLLAFGLISTGLISFGLISLGLLSLGIISIALLLAVGCISIGTVAIGAIALGIFSIGAISVGFFSVGALSVGKYVAIGDQAIGLIAIGKTKAEGTYTFLQPVKTDEVMKTIEDVVPKFWRFFIKWLKYCL